MSNSYKEIILNELDELGFDRIDPAIHHDTWTFFFQSNHFYSFKYIKDRSPNGMMHILSGGKWRWQIRIGQRWPKVATCRTDSHHDFIVALWDGKNGATYYTTLPQHLKKDTSTPIFMLRTVRLEDNCVNLIKKHISNFETYALDKNNHCPKCGDMLIPRKAKKLRIEDPYLLSKATRGRNSLPKQRTYLACNRWPECNYIQSYVKEKNETV